MKLFSIQVMKVDPANHDAEAILLASANDVSHVGFFLRNTARETLVFFARTVAKRVTPMARTAIADKGNVLYAHSMVGGRLVVCVVCDAEYPPRAACHVAEVVGDKFVHEVRGRWEAADKDAEAGAWPELESILRENRDTPQDQISKIQESIGNTRLILVDDVQKALRKGEDMAAIMQKSKDLSDASKAMHESATKMDSGCGCVVA